MAFDGPLPVIRPSRQLFLRSPSSGLYDPYAKRSEFSPFAGTIKHVYLLEAQNALRILDPTPVDPAS
jgi:hypothetical protein